MLEIVYTDEFNKRFGRLPKEIQRKFLKQVRLMKNDFRYPSLHTKRTGDGNWEARVDLHYRFKFSLAGNEVVMMVIGMHDEGLGKK